MARKQKAFCRRKEAAVTRTTKTYWTNWKRQPYQQCKQRVILAAGCHLSSRQFLCYSRCGMKTWSTGLALLWPVETRHLPFRTRSCSSVASADTNVLRLAALCLSFGLKWIGGLLEQPLEAWRLRWTVLTDEASRRAGKTSTSLIRSIRKAETEVSAHRH